MYQQQDFERESILFDWHRSFEKHKNDAIFFYFFVYVVPFFTLLDLSLFDSFFTSIALINLATALSNYLSLIYYIKHIKMHWNTIGKFEKVLIVILPFVYIAIGYFWWVQFH